MITRASLPSIFGAGANQDINYLRLQIGPSWSAEGVLASILSNLLKPADSLLQAEDGSYLMGELGESLYGFLLNRTIETELWKIILLPESRISRVFIGINEAI